MNYVPISNETFLIRLLFDVRPLSEIIIRRFNAGRERKRERKRERERERERTERQWIGGS